MAPRRYLAVSIALFAVGCTSQGVDVRDAPLAASENGIAVVRIERTVVGPSAAPVPQLDALGPEPQRVTTVVDAVFARTYGIAPDYVLELLGWPARAESLTGCSWGSTSAPAALAADAVIDLLDVGPLQLDLGGDALTARGRLFPSVSSLLAGTIYSEELAQRDAGEAAEYRIEAGGAGAIGQLESVLPAPAAPSGVTLDGRGLAPYLEIGRHEHLWVHWDAGDPSDRVEIELRAGGRLLRCSASDQGSFLVRVEALAAMPADASARISVGRVRREPLDVAGIDEAFARLVARRAVPIVLR